MRSAVRFLIILAAFVCALPGVSSLSSAASSGPAREGRPGVLVRPLKEFAGRPALRSIPGSARSNPNAWLWLLRARGKKTPTVTLHAPGGGEAWPMQNHALGQPINAYALMIDDSQSMRDAWPQARQAMKQAWTLLPEKDLAGLYAFSEKLTVLRGLEEAGQGQGVAEKSTPSRPRAEPRPCTRPCSRSLPCWPQVRR